MPAAFKAEFPQGIPINIDIGKINGVDTLVFYIAVQIINAASITNFSKGF